VKEGGWEGGRREGSEGGGMEGRKEKARRQEPGGSGDVRE
jgi:hypothetical protein